MLSIAETTPRGNASGKIQRTPRPAIVPIYLGKTWTGKVKVEDNTYYSPRLGSTQQLRSPRAWCFDRAVLRDAAAAGATIAEIYDRESGTTYRATFETIDRHGFPVRRGHGDQVGLALDYWSVNGALPVAEQRAAQTNQEREDLQMTLFGEALG